MAAETLLALWNDTATRRAIVDFVQAVSTEGSPGFVAPAERVAVFDNDGTLWSEKPVPIQLDFRWLDEAIVKHYHGDDADLGLLLGAVESAFTGMEVEAFGSEVMEWLTAASHPVLHRPYLACGFAPMVELLRYLEENGFSTYIASGGDRDFMRPFAHRIYGIPPERVIGSALGLDFDDGGDDTRLVYKSKIEFFDDGPTKPVRIWSRVGYLTYTTGAEDALDRAKTHDWTVVSMKEDWSVVFVSA
jgi:hypothetical protein